VISSWNSNHVEPMSRSHGHDFIISTVNSQANATRSSHKQASKQAVIQTHRHISFFGTRMVDHLCVLVLLLLLLILHASILQDQKDDDNNNTPFTNDNHTTGVCV